MPSTDPLTGARYPLSTDSPNGPTQIQNAVNDLSSFAIPRFSSTSARDNAYSQWVTAGHSMTNGLTCYVSGIGTQVYENGTWGPVITAATLGTNWSGAVRFSRSGRITTVNVSVTWGGSDLSVPAWTTTTMATGLPGCYLAQNAVTMPSQNNAEVPSFQFDMTNTGELLLKARWTDRTVANSTWFNGAFSYITT